MHKLKHLFPVKCSSHQLKELFVRLVEELVEFLQDGRSYMRVCSALRVVQTPLSPVIPQTVESFCFVEVKI